MSTLALTFFEALQAANVPQDKAKAAAESLDREFEQRYAAQKQDLATKTDLANTKAELLKWFIGIAIAQFSGIAYLLVRLTGKA